MNRRDLLKLGTLATAVTATSVFGASGTKEDIKSVQNAVKPLNNNDRVIIIGGGYAGLTVAKNIRLYNQKAEVIVIEAKNIFASCPYSNLWFGGVKGVDYNDLIFSPLKPASTYDYDIINDKVVSINREKKVVTTLNGSFEYSLLVLSTGIEYDYSTFGLDEKEAKKAFTKFPASYNGGFEQLSLKEKIENFKSGTFVITVPKGSYRCPPAPYERAAVIADYFKSKKLNAKVVIIDPREKPTTKAKGFLKAFDTLYKDYLEYIPNANIKKIDLDKKTIYFEKNNLKEMETTNETLVFDDANIIPSNKASKLLKDSGLELTSDGFGRVKTPTFRSYNDDNIYLVGDVVGEYPFPKSAQMAHSCGIIVGEQIARRLNKEDPKEGSVYPQNVCYSLVSQDTGIYVTHQAYFDKADGKVKVKTEFFEDIEKSTFDATKSWYAGITANIFE
ncbi:hypothetical protein CRU92_11900 [Arcobacter sp. FW59]|nr:hypothetical protein CRU92_11900 [Arcobacter sp. FW59]